MSLSRVYSRSHANINAPLISIETHLSNGLPKFTIVGLPETAIRESRDRVRSAILNSHFHFPAQIITVNLAPADLPKEGCSFDLAIAIGILAASSQIETTQLSQYEFVAELALSGELRAVPGIIPVAIATRKQQHQLVIAPNNIQEASLCQDLPIIAAKNLLELSTHLNGQTQLEPIKHTALPAAPHHTGCIREVRGQSKAKHALKICAIGGHNILFYGPPGTGKTMLSNRLNTLLPLLDEQQALEVAAIHSMNKIGFSFSKWRERPFRSPHHSASLAALVGGSNPPKPGEISLAHHGILFLDELPEFSRAALEALREPLEAEKITIARASAHVQYPASFQLIATMNPCPCGQLGNPYKQCNCSTDQIRRYRAKISEPLLERIDLWIAMPQVDKKIFLTPIDENEATSEQIRAHVTTLQAMQIKRQGCLNANIPTQDIATYIPLSSRVKEMLDDALDSFQLSSRSFYRLLRIARSIADFNQSEHVETSHCLEALSYRSLDLNDIRNGLK